MISLISTTQKLQAVLAGNVTANQLQIDVVFSDENMSGVDTKYATKQTVTNQTTDVDICAAPQQNFIRNIESISIYNADTATATITVKIDDGGAETIKIKIALATLETAVYEDSTGWTCYTTAGARK